MDLPAAVSSRRIRRHSLATTLMMPTWGLDCFFRARAARQDGAMRFFSGMGGMTMYSVELKGPKDEARRLHVNGWRQVMPFEAIMAEAAW